MSCSKKMQKKEIPDEGNSISGENLRGLQKYFRIVDELHKNPSQSLIQKLLHYQMNHERQHTEIKKEFCEVQDLIQKIINLLQERSQSEEAFLTSDQKRNLESTFNISQMLHRVEKLEIPSDLVQDVDNIVRTSSQRTTYMTSLKNDLIALASKLEFKEKSNFDEYSYSSASFSTPTAIPSLNAEDDSEFWPMENTKKKQNNRRPKNLVIPRQSHAETSTQKIQPPEKRSVKFKPILKKSQLPINDKKSPVKVQVLHINNFDDFYVRSLNAKEDQDNFLQSMQDFYNSFKNVRQLHPQKYYIGVVHLDKIWYRCRVTDVDGQKCFVFLVDFGRTEVIKTDEFCTIAYQFQEQNEMAIKCHMAYVEPLDTYGYPKESLEIFKKFTSNDQCNVKIVTVDEEDLHDSHSCIVYICGFNERKMICFNSLLVIKNYANSCGCNEKVIETEELDEEAEEVEYEKQENPETEIEFITRVPVKILKTVTPSEIYIMLESRSAELENLENAIQLGQLSNEGNNEEDEENALEHDKKFEENDICLVKDSLTWHRAKVLHSNFNSTYVTRLLDHPIDVIATKKNMQKIPAEFNDIPPIMIRAHLYGMFPNSGERWSKTSIEKFDDYVKSFQKFAVSVFDAPENSITTLPIILWGVEEKSSPLHHFEQLNYHNISYLMYDEGYADTKLKSNGDSFCVKENSLNPKTLQIIKPDEALIMSPLETCEKLYQDLISEQEMKVQLTEDIFMNFKPKRIKKWLKSSTQEVGVNFYGKAHYVNSDGAIYASSNYEDELVQLMTPHITKLYNDLFAISNNPNEVLKPGDCVIVRYAEDKCYYRGEIIRRSKTNDREYRVCYVDFGTLKNVNRCDIFTEVVAENIPLQVNRYVLSDIMPLNNAQEWSQSTLDRLHGAIVDPKIYIEVVEQTRYPEVKGVKIHLTGGVVDGYVSEFMVKHEQARKRTKDDDWPIVFQNKNDSSNFSINEMEEFIDNLQKLQHEMNQMDELALPAASSIEFKETIDVKPKETRKFVKKMVSFNFNHELVHRYSNDSDSNSEDEEDDYPSIKKSSNKRHRKVRPTKHAAKIDLRDFEDDTFECILHGIEDPLNLIFIVEPIIPTIEALYKSTMENINKFAELKLKYFRSATKSLGRSCIVPTLYDGWMRGEVKELDNEQEFCVHVKMIDLGETVKIDYRKICRTDNTLLKCPCKLLNVKIAGEKQLTRALAEEYNKKYQGKKVKINVKSYDDTDTAIVEIE